MKNILHIIGLPLLSGILSFCPSTAMAVGVGGLELKQADAIQVVSEELEISTRLVKVKYHLLNTTGSDIRSTVVFSMPAYNNDLEGEWHDGQLNSYKITVNGVKVRPSVYRVFRINGVDVTAKLRKLGLTDEQIFDPNFACFYGGNCSINPEQSKALEQMGSLGAGASEIQETAYWEQVFPAGKEVEATLEYSPFPWWSYTPGPQNDELKRIFTDEKICMDAQLAKRIIGGFTDDFRPTLYQTAVTYVFGAGGNWKGPIKNFKLILRKQGSGETISLCIHGKPVKTSSTTIEFTYKDYVPRQNFDVYFFDFGSSPEGFGTTANQ